MSRPLLSIRGDATEEEVAALVAVLQAVAAARAASPRGRPRPVSTWSSPARAVRETLRHGPGGWRASALPR